MIEEQSGRSGFDPEPFKVFISYRRADSAADARLIYERAAQRFGAENVFLDVVALEPGVRWLETIKARGRSSGAFLAVVGPQWLSILTDRSQARFSEPGEDVVKLELELALSRGSGVEVIPVLVGGASMPPGERLPKSLRALSATHAVEIRHAHFDRDVDALIVALEQVERRQADGSSGLGSAAAEVEEGGRVEEAGQVEEARTEVPPSPPAPATHGMEPDPRHFDTVIRFMAEQGTVVPLLGSRISTTLQAEQIAADLARRFDLESGSLELPRIAQQVQVSSGRADLVRSLRQILAREPEPGAVHRYFARLPQELERAGLQPQYQMIVTTNYDATLERAFEAENEPYDLAVYMATGGDSGRFVHIPYDGEPETITVPNRYGKLPIDDFGELERTLIVKIHGGVSAREKDNFVVTEDHYIDYLSSGPVESLIPVQILGKLTESHCLFLGYNTRDWHLRVFLKRIWRGEPLGSKSWAIEVEPNVLEKDFWSAFGVEFFATDLDGYMGELQRALQTRSVRA